MPPTITLAIDSASTVPEGMLTIPPMTIPANDNSQRCINSPAVFSFLSFSFSSISQDYSDASHFLPLGVFIQRRMAPETTIVKTNIKPKMFID